METIRDAPFGQLLRSYTRGHVLLYPEERSDFRLPECMKCPSTGGHISQEAIEKKSDGRASEEADCTAGPSSEGTADAVILVDWYTPNDSENPQNWSLSRKIWVTTVLMLYTFVVYCSSAIYTPSETGVADRFDVSMTKAALGLSVYVLGYGAGAMVFSPLSEIPSIGRSIPYITTFIFFVILAVPTALTPTWGGLIALRLLTGLLGSPCLATGGATVADMYSFFKLPYGLVAWVSAAVCGPALGPLLSGFAVTAENWRWSLWEILWMAIPVLVLMLLFFPETSASTLLLWRAQRLRRITGNQNYKSQSEIDQKHMNARQVFKDAIIKPVEISLLDPSICFANVYTAFCYGVYYSFFEAFPLTFMKIYGFSEGQTGIVFLSIVIGGIIGGGSYCAYNYYHLEPVLKTNPGRPQEQRLVPALFASICLPVGLFIFAWTSRGDVHWIVSAIGIVIFNTGAFTLFQCLFIYLALSYPTFAASIFAGNDLWRSSVAAGSIIFASPLFANLGIAPGVSLLAGLSCGGVVGIWVLRYFGARLRARSKFATAGSLEWT